MTAQGPAEPSTGVGDPEAAFEAMTRKLAGLTAAIEGFAARQQELHARDYGPDLAKIRERQEKFRAAIEILKQRPAIALTPEQIAVQIKDAATGTRLADHQAWANAHRQLEAAIQSIDRVVASAIAARTQRRCMAGAAGASMIVGFVLGAMLLPKIDQAVPKSWYWPEARAAGMLKRDGWNAGMRLLQVYDPKRLRALERAEDIVRDNAGELADCRARAARMRKPIKCNIRVRSG